MALAVFRDIVSQVLATPMIRLDHLTLQALDPTLNLGHNTAEFFLAGIRWHDERQFVITHGKISASFPWDCPDLLASAEIEAERRSSFERTSGSQFTMEIDDFQGR